MKTSRPKATCLRSRKTGIEPVIRRLASRAVAAAPQGEDLLRFNLFVGCSRDVKKRVNARARVCTRVHLKYLILTLMVESEKARDKNGNSNQKGDRHRQTDRQTVINGPRQRPETHPCSERIWRAWGVGEGGGGVRSAWQAAWRRPRSRILGASGSFARVTALRISQYTRIKMDMEINKQTHFSFL